ncbi:MAG: hypothetical protein QXP02_00010 [Desulfurococcaceae archaeon]
MNTSLTIARQLIHGAIKGLNAYIKPGGLHRIKPKRVFDEIICNLITTLDSVVEGIELGDKIRKGELSLAGLDQGKLLSKAIREIYRNCNVVHPQYVIPLIVGGIAIGLSNAENILEDWGKLKKAMDMICSINRWNELKQLIETLRAVGRVDMYEHLQSTGISQITIIRMGASFDDLYRVLSSKWPGFSVIESRENILYNNIKRLVDINREYQSLNHSIIALYMEMIESRVPVNLKNKLHEVRKYKYMQTAEGVKMLYELDILFKKNGISFEDVTEVITMLSAYASFEGLK